MDVSRRSFLRGAFSVAAVAVSGIPAFPASYPILHGDGEHDDTDALNALFRGDPVICEGEVIAAKDARLLFTGGHFRISGAIEMRCGHTTVDRMRLDVAPDFAGRRLFDWQSEFNRINRVDVNDFRPAGSPALRIF